MKLIRGVLLAMVVGGWTAQDVGQTDTNVSMSHAQGPLVSYGYPTGWKLESRLFGRGTPDPRFVVRMTAPDQSVVVQLQDPQAPQSFVVPQGQPNGGPTMIGQVRSSFQPYSTGAQYAAFYTKALYGQKCQDFQITDQAQAAMPPNLWLPPDVDPRRGTAGWAFFSCGVNGQEVNGAVFAATTANRLPDGRVVWAVNWLYHFIANAPRGPQAFAIAEAVSASIRLDTATLNAMYAPRPMPNPAYTPVRPDVAGSANAAFQQQQDHFRGMMDRQSRQQESFSNTLNGVAPTFNPNSGQTELRPYTSGDNHFVNGLGNHIDSTNPFTPNGFTRLENR